MCTYLCDLQSLLSNSSCRMVDRRAKGSGGHVPGEPDHGTSEEHALLFPFLMNELISRM